jgi:DNA repair ATPase RecN
MAWSRKQVGAVWKKDKEKQKYADVPEFSIKITEDITLKAGEYVNLENKAFKLASLEANRSKMSEEVYTKSRERIENMPANCFFEIVKIKKEG